MTTKIKVGELDAKLRAANIIVDTVRLTSDQKIELVFPKDTDDSVKAQALTIVASYDQAAEDAAKARKEVTQKDIDGAKTVDDLKALLTRMLAKG